ncbi:hypothetical protein Q5P01_018976 [Channa striata]|uniref:G-protein coupled receptors family 1 profile domain-containing protein n=1 Tax=Channa striata TaxID=64152 RepID=A0AA88M1P6_CHASR|nr:hypothetical protein Q5P01_018976 [Channa striata]
MFGTTSHTALMIMAFDRYVAICNPLRYAAIMTNKMVIKLTVSAWAVAFVLVGILLGLTVRLNRCRTLITNSHCDNASLFKLSCDDVFINNVYGLTFTVVLYTTAELRFVTVFLLVCFYLARPSFSMDNETANLDFLQLEGLKFSPGSSIPVFVLLLLIYIFIMVSNSCLVVLITMDRSLHEPMYLLFCNMSINDVFGSTAVLPRLLSDVFTPPVQRYIHFYDCAIQAFCAHFFGGTCHTVLMIMAFDRYMAICHPLRYATIMTKKMVVTLSVSAWGVSFILIAILLSLSLRLSRCRRIIENPFCDNASLFKLSCENVLINHIYGLWSSMTTMACSFISIMITYLRIAMVCLSRKNQSLNIKALQTCATHLAVYIILLLSGGIIIILHRFPELSDHRKLASILFHVVPPSMNALIYGLQIKVVRQKIFILLTGKK